MISTILVTVIVINAYLIFGALLLLFVQKTVGVEKILRLIIYTQDLPKEDKHINTTESELAAIAAIWPLWVVLAIFKTIKKLITR